MSPDRQIRQSHIAKKKYQQVIDKLWIIWELVPHKTEEDNNYVTERIYKKNPPKTRRWKCYPSAFESIPVVWQLLGDSVHTLWKTLIQWPHTLTRLHHTKHLKIASFCSFICCDKTLLFCFVFLFKRYRDLIHRKWCWGEKGSTESCTFLRGYSVI